MPQPDGPMMAVTELTGKIRSMPCTAWCFEKKASSLRVSIGGAPAARVAAGAAEGTGVGAGVASGIAGAAGSALGSGVIGPPAYGSCGR